ncbi:hypothetical protein BDN72DRAFT_845283 [Pluteus cervinus]|uniref:Uncharacterized protein n=1 Tax=Pluteus cervinus TaxID=181527 RepID=A0ACD3AJR7_9AGAR|nr:hypothetical protein BDN72DRAFT_845283 [Pluteus cervinus]
MLPLIDIAHRGLVYSLVGLSFYGLYIGYSAHEHTMQRGRELLARRETTVQLDKVQEEREIALAEAAQAALRAKHS